MSAILKRERAFLAQADHHIADLERHISKQEVEIARLHVGGYDTIEAERALGVFQETLVEHRAHRRLILERIAYLED